jgi:mRNA-degrading endonuclease toxin of MazEF toxin-antitoxin module
MPEELKRGAVVTLKPESGYGMGVIIQNDEDIQKQAYTVIVPVLMVVEPKRSPYIVSFNLSVSNRTQFYEADCKIIQTIAQSMIGSVIGHLQETDIREINYWLLTVLGMGV